MSIQCDPVVENIDDNVYFDIYRWLSKGRSLERVWKIRMELVQFLEEIGSDDARNHLELLSRQDTLMDLAFLVVMMGHLNQLNLQLQGEKNYVGQMWKIVKGFVAKLRLFYNDVTNSRDHFPTLKTFIDDECMENLNTAEVCEKAGRFISDVERDFSNRFDTCKKIDGLIDLITVPQAENQVKWKEQLPNFITEMRVADVELEMCDFMADRSTLHKLETTATSAF